jgi:3-phenylpropionate/trans-cinnamate dioxygenase ferredoxin component
MTFEQVTTLDDLAVGSARQVELGGEPICVVRVDEHTVRACHDTCSHEEYPLHEGWVGSGEIECALHGSTFDLETGEALALPAVQPIPVYAAKIDGDGIWVDVEAQLNDAPVPRH